ncbi:MAG: MMPL family transporter [Actinobacteria bacterium]|nr:MMPL family transporter [Actinomycetota bacterium]
MPDTNGSRGWFASMEDLAERPSEEQTAPAGADDGVQEDETGPMPVVSERAGDPGKQRAEVLTPKRQLRPEAQRQSAKPRRSEPRRRPERRGRTRPDRDDGRPRGRIRRPVALLVAAVLITGGLGFAATRLQADASASLLMDTSSAVYHEQAQFARLFGADPVVVLAEPAPGQGGQLLTPGHLVGLAQLEGNLSRLHGVSRVYGPGSLVNTFATLVTQRALQLCSAEGQKGKQAAEAAAKARGESAAAQTKAGNKAFTVTVKACAHNLAAKYPSLSLPALNNPSFFNQLLLEGNGKVRPFWRGVLPSSSRALISVRMDQNASLNDVTAVERTVSKAKLGPKQRTITSNGQRSKTPTMAGNLTGLSLTVSGTPSLMASLARSARGSLLVLLPAALAAMLVLTLLVLRVPFRLLAVLLAALAGIWTAGAAALLHLPITPATLAVLPVVLGLGTDYVLQSVNRLVEEEGTPDERFASMVRAILPATGMAAGATAAGVLAFAVSGVPLVRQFGLFLALGVAMSWLASVMIALPLLSLLVRRARPRRRHVPSWNWLARPVRIPALALIPVILAGVAGWAALSATKIETNPTRLLPSHSAAVANAQTVARQIGYAGELDLVVTGPDVSRPDVVAWMGHVQQQLQGKDLSAVNGLPGFLLGFNYGKAPSEKVTRTILSRLPKYFTQSVVSPDRRTALVTFGQKNVASLTQDTQLINRIDQVTANPPAGFHAYPAGLAVVAASALHALLRDQVLLNLLALAVVLVVLVIAFRRPLLGLLAVLPTVVAAGLATGAEYLLHIEGTPITILLSGVVVAFATEFSVLWLSRYRAERADGTPPRAAAEVASRRIGPAIVAAALALIAGFGALALSPVPMVRGFGIWCAADLALATVAVLLVLPSLTPRMAPLKRLPIRS